MDSFNGRLLFFTVVVFYNYGDSLLIKFNLRNCVGLLRAKLQ